MPNLKNEGKSKHERRQQVLMDMSGGGIGYV